MEAAEFIFRITPDVRVALIALAESRGMPRGALIRTLIAEEMQRTTRISSPSQTSSTQTEGARR
jgi:hypothetical protein